MSLPNAGFHCHLLPAPPLRTPCRPPSNQSGGSSSCDSTGRQSLNSSGRPSKLSHRQRVAANQRERRRMTSLNTAFDVLRKTLPGDHQQLQQQPPTLPADKLHAKRPRVVLGDKKPISKVETLRQAIDYIAQLQELLHGSDANQLSFTPNGVAAHLVCQLPDPVSPDDCQSACSLPLNQPPVSAVSHRLSYGAMANNTPATTQFNFYWNRQLHNSQGFRTPLCNSSISPSPNCYSTPPAFLPQTATFY